LSARRLFFALWPEAGVGAQLQQLAQMAEIAGGRAPVVADLHVTLCFLGAVPDAVVAELSRRAADISAATFELEFDGLAYWKRSRVLAAVCTRVPAAALALAGALRISAESLGLRPDDRPWRPHVTLRRGLASGATPMLPRLPAGPLRLTARSFYLAQSQELEATTASATASARYRRLAAWPLQTTGH
jgi:2'-5' RNA ligase